MSKVSNSQRLAVLKIWLEDLKKNKKQRNNKKQPKWLLEDLTDDD
jgi:hypothetical protein